MRSGKWDARISRSRELALKYPSAAEGLRFYGHIAQFQKSLYDDLEIECGKEPVARLPGMLRQELDLFILLPRFGGISFGGRKKWACAFGTGGRIAAREWWNAMAGSSDQLLASRFAISRRPRSFADASRMGFPSALCGISGRLHGASASSFDTCDLSALFFASGGGSAAAGR